MFQYAFGRSLSVSLNCSLVFDVRSFARDYKYRRKFELLNLPVLGRIAKPRELMPVYFRSLYLRIFCREQKVSTVSVNFLGAFIEETDYSFIPVALSRGFVKKKIYIAGYWQSPRYFNQIKDVILRELTPPRPNSPMALDLGASMRSTESVAIGLRLYEESSNPGAHAVEGRLKTMSEYRNVITDLLSRIPDAKLFVFCTHMSPLIFDLGLPDSATFVTHDQGFCNSVERLWLLTQCKHHTFNNSSFYWWGAFLSQAVWPNERQIILAADNFLSRDIYSAGWGKW